MTTSTFISKLELFQKQYRKGIITLEELERITCDTVFEYFAENNSEDRNKEKVTL